MIRLDLGASSTVKGKPTAALRNNKAQYHVPIQPFSNLVLRYWGLITLAPDNKALTRSYATWLWPVVKTSKVQLGGNYR